MSFLTLWIVLGVSHFSACTASISLGVHAVHGYVQRWCGPHSRLSTWKSHICSALEWYHTAVALSSSPLGAGGSPCWRLTCQGREHRYHPSTLLDILPCTSERRRVHLWGQKRSVPTRKASRVLRMPWMLYCLHSWSHDDRFYPGPSPWTRSSPLDFLGSLEFAGWNAGLLIEQPVVHT